MRKCIWLVIILSVFAGCRSIEEISSLGPQAKTRIGQMLYRTPKRSFAADVYLSTLANGDYALTMTKGDVTILQLEARDETLTAAGLLVRNGFTGGIRRLPSTLRPWADLRAIIPHFDRNENQAEAPGRWHATFERTSGSLTEAEIRFQRGTTMIFSFGR